MAVDNKNYALNLEQVQTLTKTLEPDILESAALVNNRIFEDLKINVLTDIESVNAVMVFNRHTGTTRKYKAGKVIANNVGFMEERPLKVTLAVNRHLDNIQNYREKEPFSVLGTNVTYKAPNSEWMIRQIGIIHSGDILNCLFHGDESLGEDSPLGIYDGFFAKIRQDINAGKISTAHMNYVELDPIGTTPDGSAEDNYNTFINFYNSLDPKLQAAEVVYVYCSLETKMHIVNGYLKSYVGMQTPDANKPGFRFLGAPNVELVAHPVIGKGDCLIATVPYNFEYGTDMRPGPEGGSVNVGNSQDDFNILIYQIQTAQGVRIRQISSDKFCISNGKNKPVTTMGGEYQKESLTVTSNDETLGKVTVSPQKDTYEVDDKVTLTATAESTGEFVKWSDGATVNPRVISFSGTPEVYQAIFQKKEDAGG